MNKETHVYSISLLTSHLFAIRHLVKSPTGSQLLRYGRYTNTRVTFNLR